MKKIMISGASSGSGKTTIVCALLQCLIDRGEAVSSFKCGPDYIDPMFHREVIGAPSYNLDSYFMDSETLRYLFLKNSSDISVIEGVMGFYDGMAFTDKASSYEISQITDTPVILVIDGKGIGNSVGAIIRGFLSYRQNNIKGVIFNRVTAAAYERMKVVCEAEGVKPLGYLPFSGAAKIESRYLGLVTATEIEINDLRAKLRALCDTAKQTLDIDGILEVAAEETSAKVYASLPEKTRARIAVARDRAFNFYYEDNLRLLRELGAEIVEFSPLSDTELPQNIDGLIIGGGYPELYAEILSQNKSMLKSVRDAVASKLPCIAECGGFMYLHEGLCDVTGRRYEMVGAIEGEAFKTERLQRFGYIEMEAQRDNVLCKKGEKIKAHEFHYYDSENNGVDFTARKNNCKWGCAHADESLFAGYPHMHFYTDKKFAENFMNACEKRRKQCMK